METDFIETCLAFKEASERSGSYRSVLGGIRINAAKFKEAKLDATVDELLSDAYRAMYELYFSLEYKEDLMYRDNSALFESLTTKVNASIDALKSYQS